MADTSSSSSGGIGFTGLLTVLFVGLKLTAVDWRCFRTGSCTNHTCSWSAYGSV